MTQAEVTAASGLRERVRWRQDLACYLLFLTALAFVASVRWDVRNMPLERDEGEYAYVGQSGQFWGDRARIYIFERKER